MPGCIGILGGLGPLASAEFLKTVYQYNGGTVEQQAPIVFLYSDPSFPDRTEAFLRGEDDALLARLVGALDKMDALGARTIIICCVTMHHLLPRLPHYWRDRIPSLVDVALAEAMRSQRQHLLLCTNGTRAMRIFERHDRWPVAQEYVVLPGRADQEAIHDILYRIKGNADLDALLPQVQALLATYGVHSFIAGCTEGHLLTKHLVQHGNRYKGIGYVDPLLILAHNLKELAHE